MYVEFFGMPGVGKTTITNELCKRKDYAKIKKVNSIFKLSLLNSIKAYYRMRKIYNIIINRYYWSMFECLIKQERKMIKKALFVCLYHYYKTRYSDKTYITDHGIIQSLSQLKFFRYHSTEKEFIDDILKQLPEDEVCYIYLKSTEKIVYNRGKKRAKNTNTKYDRTLNDLSVFNHTYDMIALNSISSSKFIFCPNGHNKPKTIANEIYGILELSK